MNKIRLICLIIFSIIICNCALKTSYLSKQSHLIHKDLWKADSFIHSNLMPGTDNETPIFHFNSPKAGPTILILGGTHGNEPAGFEAAHRLLRKLSTITLKKGNIYIIPEANKIACLNNKRRIPVPKGINNERGNLNRCYPGDSTGLPMEQAAYQIIKLMRNNRINILLDLHESPVFHLEMKDKTSQYHGLGQTLIYTPNEEATWLGMVALDQLNSSLPPGNKQFSLVEQPIKHSAAWAAGQYFNIPGFTVETCKKLPLEERITYQLQIINMILKEKAMI